VNLDFYMFNDTVFTLDMRNIYPLFKLLDDDENFIRSPQMTKLIQETANKLLTVCTVYDELPNIMYQANSEFSKELAMKVHNSLKEFYKRSKKVRPREPRGNLLIVDRGFDIISPVMHDYFYQNIVYDVKDVSDSGKTKADNRIVYLNEQDDLWVRYRY
jgi:syntaxin-binding protein 1